MALKPTLRLWATFGGVEDEPDQPTFYRGAADASRTRAFPAVLAMSPCGGGLACRTVCGSVMHLCEARRAAPPHTHCGTQG